MRKWALNICSNEENPNSSTDLHVRIEPFDKKSGGNDKILTNFEIHALVISGLLELNVIAEKGFSFYLLVIMPYLNKTALNKN